MYWNISTYWSKSRSILSPNTYGLFQPVALGTNCLYFAYTNIQWYCPISSSCHIDHQIDIVIFDFIFCYITHLINTWFVWCEHLSIIMGRCMKTFNFDLRAQRDMTIPSLEMGLSFLPIFLCFMFITKMCQESIIITNLELRF